jgi:hypothetical protein
MPIGHLRLETQHITESVVSVHDHGEQPSPIRQVARLVSWARRIANRRAYPVATFYKDASSSERDPAGISDPRGAGAEVCQSGSRTSVFLEPSQKLSDRQRPMSTERIDEYTKLQRSQHGQFSACFEQRSKFLNL